jgi:hypothetical protein
MHPLFERVNRGEVKRGFQLFLYALQWDFSFFLQAILRVSRSTKSHFKASIKKQAKPFCATTLP